MSQRLVGYGVSQVPTNGMLGGMAYQDPINVTVNNISVGSGTLTGTASQPLQVTGGAYVSGNLGVGVTNPESLFHINGDATALRISRGSAIGFVYNTGTSAVDPFRIQSNGGSVDLYSVAGHPITFSAGGTEKVRVAGSGSVGIGTTNPIAKLDVRSELKSSGATLLVLSSTDATDQFQLAVSRSAAGSGSYYSINSIEQNVAFRNLLLNQSGGNVGIGTINPQYTLHVVGSFAATTKSFVITHPTKPNYKLQHGSLEGPENGVYIRGRTTENIIELPEYWTELVDKNSITVNLTPIGDNRVWIEEINNNKVYIDSNSDIDCFYTVFAERKDVEKLVVEIEEN